MIGGWDNMDHDEELLSELKKEATLRRRQRLAPRTINDSTTPKIEMVVQLLVRRRVRQPNTHRYGV